MIPILGPIISIFNKLVPDPDKQAELKKALMDHEEKLEEGFREYARQDHNLRIKEMEFKGFKAAWRPVIMFSLSFVMVSYLFLYYLLPQLIVVSGLNIYYLEPVPMPDMVWQVFAFCVVGIGGLRTIDKWRRK